MSDSTDRLPYNADLHPAPDYVTIRLDRAKLERQHRTLIAYLNALRELLGHPPLPTGKQQRRQEEQDFGKPIS